MSRTVHHVAIVVLAAAACLLASRGRARGAAVLRVVTTTADLAALAREVGGEKVKVESLAHGYQDPHFVDPKPSFIVKLNRADLYVKRGLDLEVGWAPVLETGARNPRIFPGGPGYVDASEGVALLEVPGGQVDRSLGDIHVFGNPHYQLDPQNALVMARNIAAGLARVAPADASYFAGRRAAFESALRARLKGWEKVLSPYRGAKVVTYHKSWEYLARRFGLSIIGYVEPKPGVPASPAHLARLITLMRAQGARLIITAPYYPERPARLVAERAGAGVLVLPESPGGADDTDDYFAFMDYCVHALAQALAQAQAGSEGRPSSASAREASQ